MSRTFVTLFPGTDDYHLFKDIGMIPYTLGREFGYSSRVATLRREASYPSLDRLSDGLGLEFIPYDGGAENDAVLRYVERHAREIDVLQVYHWLPAPLSWLAAYKALNPGGVAYLKLDAGRQVLATPFAELFDGPQQTALEMCDLITVETTELHRGLGSAWPVRVELLPNGFDDAGLGSPVASAEKDDGILSVGRLGTWEKATDVLVQAYARAFPLLGGYPLSLVGTVEPDFHDTVRGLLDTRPELEGSIELTGPIRDRQRLWQMYRSARVFCLPSRYECLPVVLAEALAAGCWLVCSDTPAAEDVTDGGRFGDIFPVDDVDALATCLLRASVPGDDSPGLCSEAQEYARDRFAWRRIGKTLHELLEAARPTGGNR